MRSTLDIEELERLEKAATPGPWYQSGSPWYNSGALVIAGSEDGNIAATVADLDLLGAREEYEGPFKLVDPDYDATFIAALRNAAPALIAAAKKLETYQRMDAEAATHVESVLCLRTDFAEIDPDESGWKGLGAALNRALDERDASKVELARLRDTLKRAENVIEIATSESVLFDPDDDGALERIEAARDCLAAIREAL